MKMTTLGQVIASRKLTIANGQAAEVLIGSPRPFSDKEDGFYCPFQIRGLGDGQVRHAGGVDAVQAMILALQRVGTLLNASEEAKNARLSWECGISPGDFGFPTIELPHPPEPPSMTKP